MPRLIPPVMGNGKRPSDPNHQSGKWPQFTVPVLDVSDKTHELVATRHAQALDTENEDVTLLVGTVVRLENGSASAVTQYVIGGSTLHEAVTEVIGSFGDHGDDMPNWVASTNQELADVLAEHFTLKGYHTCKIIPMEDTAL